MTEKLIYAVRVCFVFLLPIAGAAFLTGLALQQDAAVGMKVLHTGLVMIWMLFSMCMFHTITEKDVGY